MIRKLYNVTRIEIDDEGNVSSSVITCNCKEKAEAVFKVQKAEIISEYTYLDDEENVDYTIEEDEGSKKITFRNEVGNDEYVVEDKGAVWVIKFPFEETKIVLKMEEAITNFDDDVEDKHMMEIAYNILDTQQEACIETLRDCFNECSTRDVDLLKAVTICKDYVRDLKEDM